MTSPFYEDVRELPSGRWERDPDRSWRPVQPPPGADRAGRGWAVPTLGLNVADFGSGWDGPRYARVNGMVTLRGAAGFTGSVASGGTLLTLPPGYRPGISMAFAQASSGGVVRVDVAPSGVVSCNGTAFTTGGFLSLSGIEFLAEA